LWVIEGASVLAANKNSNLGYLEERLVGETRRAFKSRTNAWKE